LEGGDLQVIARTEGDSVHAGACGVGQRVQADGAIVGLDSEVFPALKLEPVAMTLPPETSMLLPALRRTFSPFVAVRPLFACRVRAVPAMTLMCWPAVICPLGTCCT
ncbi:hypothetical protein D8B27_20495, partial [Verminephrobacter aporrectodeae subsp. tuberculatae]|nr:hypothetical protein [Verminephrobacter aporrectodeae subsp. tuberculatae]